MPPCPGRIFPESLIFKLRLNNDSNKSPNIEHGAIIKAAIIQKVGG